MASKLVDASTYLSTMYDGRVSCMLHTELSWALFHTCMFFLLKAYHCKNKMEYLYFPLHIQSQSQFWQWDCLPIFCLICRSHKIIGFLM